MWQGCMYKGARQVRAWRLSPTVRAAACAYKGNAADLSDLMRTCMTHGMCMRQVAPSIAAVRFAYEALVQAWGVGGLRKYRGAPSDLPPTMQG